MLTSLRSHWCEGTWMLKVQLIIRTLALFQRLLLIGSVCSLCQRLKVEIYVDVALQPCVLTNINYVLLQAHIPVSKLLQLSNIFVPILSSLPNTSRLFFFQISKNIPLIAWPFDSFFIILKIFQLQHNIIIPLRDLNLHGLFYILWACQPILAFMEDQNWLKPHKSNISAAGYQ